MPPRRPSLKDLALVHAEAAKLAERERARESAAAALARVRAEQAERVGQRGGLLDLPPLVSTPRGGSSFIERDEQFDLEDHHGVRLSDLEVASTSSPSTSSAPAPPVRATARELAAVARAEAAAAAAAAAVAAAAASQLLLTAAQPQLDSSDSSDMQHDQAPHEQLHPPELLLLHQHEEHDEHQHHAEHMQEVADEHNHLRGEHLHSEHLHDEHLQQQHQQHGLQGDDVDEQQQEEELLLLVDMDTGDEHSLSGAPTADSTSATAAAAIAAAAAAADTDTVAVEQHEEQHQEQQLLDDEHSAGFSDHMIV
eukprot:4261-Heterococcus_DN1.PRE.2